mgnify:CR=1 FL=1
MSVQSTRSSRPLLGFYLAIGAWLIVHAWIALSASVHKSTTNDEVAHITGGYTFNLLHDFRVQPENGVLPQRWHALPFLWKNSQYPDFGGYAWNRGLAYQVAYDFFYRSDNDPEDLLFTGRAMNVFWGAGVLILIAFTTHRFFGTTAAITTTGAAALSPTLLAHSALATSDMAMTFFFLASTLAFWRHINRPDLRTFALSSVIFGLACVAKFSAVMLLPMMVVMLAVRSSVNTPVPGIWTGNNNTWLQRITTLSGWWLVHGLVAMIVIWLFYGFRFSMISPDLPVGTMPLAWEDILSAHPGWEPLIFTLRDIKILPEAFLYGFSYVLAFSLARGAFLDGQLGTEGWVDFFPRTFLYKSTPLELLSLGLMFGILGWWWFKEKSNKLRAVYRWTPGIVLLIVYWAFSLTSNLNIGHRHILPTYPLLFIASGCVIWVLPRFGNLKHRRGPATVVIGGALLLGQLSSLAAIYPHHLAYFNGLSGGASRGYERLVDSSLDWGQDLPGVAQYSVATSDSSAPHYLAYFGTGEPAQHQIQAKTVMRLPKFDLDFDWFPLRAGKYAISATLLQHVYRQNHQPWSAESESTYQNLRNLETSFWAMNGHPEQHPDLLDGASADEWHHAWDLYSELRFARLCEYLKIRPPEAMIGYSILIFDLNQQELDQALAADLPALIRLIEANASKVRDPEIY